MQSRKYPKALVEAFGRVLGTLGNAANAKSIACVACFLGEIGGGVHCPQGDGRPGNIPRVGTSSLLGETEAGVVVNSDVGGSLNCHQGDGRPANVSQVGNSLLVSRIGTTSEASDVVSGAVGSVHCP